MQTTNRTSEIVRGLVTTAIAIQPTRMLSSVAYASLSGCNLLHKLLLDANPAWNEIKKDWLIGLDNGITESKSLEYLAGLPNSTVHLYDAEYLLNNDLNPRQKFHTKLYIFESSKDHTLGMFSGSANLTFSGLSLNTEQAISVVFNKPITNDEQHSLDRLYEQKQILERVFDTNVEFSQHLCERYRELCEHRQELVKNEDNRRTPRSLDTNQPEPNLNVAIAMAAATNFWVEIRYVVKNLGKELPGNQIELQRGSRVFFGFDAKKVPTNTLFGSRIIRYENQDHECNMRFGNNQMDKLNLPAPNDINLDTYENKILLFTRLSDEIFNLQIYPRGNIEGFKELSSQQNLFKMKGGREFGVY
jgi:HKD family nuclease